MDHYEMEEAVLRGTFPGTADKWLPGLEAALETADESEVGSARELAAELGRCREEFKRLIPRRREIAEQAGAIRKEIVAEEHTTLEFLLPLEARAEELHEEASELEEKSIWALIRALVCLRKMKRWAGELKKKGG